MTQVTLEEARSQLEALMRAAVEGEEVVITSEDRKFQLIPVREGPGPRFGSAIGRVWMSDDFDEPLEEFKEYRV